MSYDLASLLKKLAQFYFKMRKRPLKWIPWDDGKVQLQGHVRLISSGLQKHIGTLRHKRSPGVFIMSMTCPMLNPVLEELEELERNSKDAF